MSRSTATTGRECHGRLTLLARWSVRDVGGGERVVEHGNDRAVDIGWRVCGVEVASGRIRRRRARLKTWWNIRDIVVGEVVFVIGEARIRILDRLVWNIENHNLDTAARECGAG